MAASWTLVLVAVVSFLVIGHIETTVAQDLPATAVEGPTTANSSPAPTNAHNVTVDQLLGKWYVVSIIFPYVTTNLHLSCIKINVVRGDNGDKSFDVLMGENDRHNGTVTYKKGRIDDNKIVTHLQNSPDNEAVETIRFYNNGEEFIAKYENKDHYEWHSRSTKASLETLNIFESVIKPDMSIVYVHHDNCP